MLPHLRIKIRVSRNDIANKTKNLSTKLQYASSHAANDITVKRVIADAGVSVDAKWRADEIWIQNSGIRTSLVNIRRPKMARRRRNFDVAAPQGRAAQSKPMQQTRVSVALVTMAGIGSCKMRNAFNHDHYRVIVLYCYRDNFYLSYRLSIID